MVDVIMMANFNAKERELEDWAQVFKMADPRLRISKHVTPPTSVFTIMEVELVDEAETPAPVEPVEVQQPATTNGVAETKPNGEPEAAPNGISEAANIASAKPLEVQAPATTNGVGETSATDGPEAASSGIPEAAGIASSETVNNADSEPTKVFVADPPANDTSEDGTDKTASKAAETGSFIIFKEKPAEQPAPVAETSTDETNGNQ